jgi:hypothetical protein
MNLGQQPRRWVITSIFGRMTTNPLLTAFAAFILATAVVVSITLGSYGYGGNFLENILVEAH